MSPQGVQMFTNRQTFSTISSNMQHNHERLNHVLHTCCNRRLIVLIAYFVCLVCYTTTITATNRMIPDLQTENKYHQSLRSVGGGGVGGNNLQKHWQTNVDFNNNNNYDLEQAARTRAAGDNLRQLINYYNQIGTSLPAKKSSDGGNLLVTVDEYCSEHLFECRTNWPINWSKCNGFALVQVSTGTHQAANCLPYSYLNDAAIAKIALAALRNRLNLELQRRRSLDNNRATSYEVSSSLGPQFNLDSTPALSALQIEKLIRMLQEGEGGEKEGEGDGEGEKEKEKEEQEGEAEDNEEAGQQKHQFATVVANLMIANRTLPHEQRAQANKPPTRTLLSNTDKLEGDFAQLVGSISVISGGQSDDELGEEQPRDDGSEASAFRRYNRAPDYQLSTRAWRRYSSTPSSSTYRVSAEDAKRFIELQHGIGSNNIARLTQQQQQNDYYNNNNPSPVRRAHLFPATRIAAPLEQQRQLATSSSGPKSVLEQLTNYDTNDDDGDNKNNNNNRRPYSSSVRLHRSEALGSTPYLDDATGQSDSHAASGRFKNPNSGAYQLVATNQSLVHGILMPAAADVAQLSPAEVELKFSPSSLSLSKSSSAATTTTTPTGGGGGGGGNSLECSKRQFTFVATKQDAAGNQCSGLIKTSICYGGCDTGEIADWLFPHKKSIHKVCRHGQRIRRRAYLNQCSSPDVDPSLHDYHYVDAADCVCKKCVSADTTCLGSVSQPQLQTLDEAVASLDNTSNALATK